MGKYYEFAGALHILSTHKKIEKTRTTRKTIEDINKLISPIGNEIRETDTHYIVAKKGAKGAGEPLLHSSDDSPSPAQPRCK